MNACNGRSWEISLDGVLRLPLILVAIHAIVLMLLTPIMLATVNSEAAPLGYELVGLFDFPAYWLAETLIPENWLYIDANVWWLVVFPLVIGSLQWFTIGLGISFVRKYLG